MIKQKIVTIAAVTALLFTTACSNALLVSGTTLKTTGAQFRTVAAAYVDGCARDAIPVEDCNNFTEFGENFKEGFPLAVDLWTVAKEADDKSATAKAVEVITGLAASLSAFTVKVLNTVVNKGAK